MSERPPVPPPSQIKESNTREGLFFAPFPFYIFVLTFLSFSLYVTFCEPFFWVRAKPIKKLLRSTFFSLNVLREIFSSTQRIKYCHKIRRVLEKGLQHAIWHLWTVSNSKKKNFVVFEVGLYWTDSLIKIFFLASSC